MDYPKLYETTYKTYFSLIEKMYQKKFMDFCNEGYTFNLTFNEHIIKHGNYNKFLETHLKQHYNETCIKLFNDRFLTFEDNRIQNIIEKRIKPLLRKNKELDRFNFNEFVYKIAKLDALKETSRIVSNNYDLYDRMFVLKDFKHFELKSYPNGLRNTPLFKKLDKRVYPTPKQSKSKIVVKETSEDEYLTVKEVAELTNYKVPTIYDLKHKKKIPFYKKGAKLQFKKSEILAWIENGKGTTRVDLEAKANAYILKNS